MSDTQTNLNANSASKLELFLKYFPVAALSLCVLIAILFIDFRPICEATSGELAARAKTGGGGKRVQKGKNENPTETKRMDHVTRHSKHPREP